MTKSGIFIVDKPSGYTTNQVIQKIKKQFQIHKIGHAGTLDPLASGVVICLVNEGTKLSNFFLQAEKSYLVTMKLFIETDTGDAEGKVIKRTKPRVLELETLTKIWAKFQNYSYLQHPPIYSAIKFQGKKLYQYARQGQVITVPPRAVVIKSLTIQKVVGDEITFETTVSKGTYIRSLVADLAAELGTVAHVKFLRRLSSGTFSVSEAKPLENLTAADLLSLKNALLKAKHSIKSMLILKRIAQGQPIKCYNCQTQAFFISDHEGQIHACYRHQGNGVYVCQRGLKPDLQ